MTASTYLYGAFVYYYRVTYVVQSKSALYSLPESQGTPCSKQAPYLKFMWLLRNSLTKWLSVRLRTKWLWVQIPLQSLKLQIWRLLRARGSLAFRQTIECRFTPNLVRDMIITCGPLNFQEMENKAECAHPLKSVSYISAKTITNSS